LPANKQNKSFRWFSDDPITSFLFTSKTLQNKRQVDVLHYKKSRKSQQQIIDDININDKLCSLTNMEV